MTAIDNPTIPVEALLVQRLNLIGVRKLHTEGKVSTQGLRQFEYLWRNLSNDPERHSMSYPVDAECLRSRYQVERTHSPYAFDASGTEYFGGFRLIRTTGLCHSLIWEPVGHALDSIADAVLETGELAVQFADTQRLMLTDHEVFCFMQDFAGQVTHLEMRSWIARWTIVAVPNSI